MANFEWALRLSANYAHASALGSHRSSQAGNDCQEEDLKKSKEPKSTELEGGGSCTWRLHHEQASRFVSTAEQLLPRRHPDRRHRQIRASHLVRCRHCVQRQLGLPLVHCSRPALAG